MAVIGFEPEDVRALLRVLTAAVTRIETKQDALAEVVDEVKEHVKITNGRVTRLELDQAVEKGAALQRAATIEDVRQVRAADLARNAWIKPGLMATAAAVAGALVGHLIG